MFTIKKLSDCRFEIVGKNGHRTIMNNCFIIDGNKIIENCKSITICVYNSVVTKLENLDNECVLFSSCNLESLTIEKTKNLSMCLNSSKIKKICLKTTKNYNSVKKVFKKLSLISSETSFSDDIEIEELQLRRSKVKFKKVFITQWSNVVNSKFNIRSLQFVREKAKCSATFQNVTINNFKGLNLVNVLRLKNVKTKGFDCFFPKLKSLVLENTKIKEIDKYIPEKMHDVTIIDNPIKKIGAKKIGRVVSDKIFDEENLSIDYYKFKNTLRKNIVIKKTKIEVFGLFDSYVENIEVDADLEINNCPFIRNDSQLKVKKALIVNCSAYNVSLEKKKRSLEICKNCSCFSNKKWGIIGTTCFYKNASPDKCIIFPIIIQFHDSSIYEYIELPEDCSFEFEQKVEAT